MVGTDKTLLRSSVDAMLGSLTEREALVLRMRFGLGGRSPSTLESIGRRIGLTRERARQIESGALKKLRGAVPSNEVVIISEGPRDRANGMGGWEKKGFPSRLLLVELAENAFEQGAGTGDGNGGDGVTAVDQPDSRREGSPTT